MAMLVPAIFATVATSAPAINISLIHKCRKE